MARILVTGGPVHTKLDAVKIITNRFKGGRMVMLAKALEAKGHTVTYLTSKHTVPPHKLRALGEGHVHMAIATHDGFVDYMEKIELLAPQYDMVVLGAAVANLVPEPPWDVTQKFPSHDYEVGDKVMIPFRVAPRVINLVKEANPRVTLVGFKLLSGVTDTELLRAAYTITMDAKADLVVANDAERLDRKLLVTKERSVIQANDEGLANFLDQLARDEHYRTREEYDYQVPEGQPVGAITRIMKEAARRYERVRGYYEAVLENHGRCPQSGLLFGCIATRSINDGFVCSSRGKTDLKEFVHVAKVNHYAREVCSIQGKASLNAPLLDNLFKAHPRAKAIVHTHRTDTDLPRLPWAPPGTVRDSRRDLPTTNFEIEHHGIFMILEELP